MALPQFCDLHVPACCETWFNLADDLRQLAVAGYCGEGCPEPIASWVNHGRPAAMGDFIAVWLDNIKPVPGANPVFVRRRYTFGIVLQEGGFPVPTESGAKITLPTGPEYNYAALHSYAHAQSVYEKIWTDLAQSQTCTLHAISNLAAETPEGGHVRWTFGVEIDR